LSPSLALCGLFRKKISKRTSDSEIFGFENIIMEKKTIYLGMIIGGVAGGYVPALWGAGLFSTSSIICSALGAIIGIWLTFKFLN